MTTKQYTVNIPYFIEEAFDTLKGAQLVANALEHTKIFKTLMFTGRTCQGGGFEIRATLYKPGNGIPISTITKLEQVAYALHRLHKKSK